MELEKIKEKPAENEAIDGIVKENRGAVSLMLDAPKKTMDTAVLVKQNISLSEAVTIRALITEAKEIQSEEAEATKQTNTRFTTRKRKSSLITSIFKKPRTQNSINIIIITDDD